MMSVVLARLCCALAIAGATATPMHGLWSVRTLVRGSADANVQLVCFDSGRWLTMALPAFARDPCLATVTIVPTDVPCAYGGRLTVSGVFSALEFSLVVKRTGTVGINRGASVTVMSEGRRISERCPR